MRPDEHKKRKNTAYKKKHGIKDAGDKKDEKSKKDKSTENKTKVAPSGSGHGTKELKTAAKAENSSSNVSSSDTENEGTTSRKGPSKSFRKRQIVSNWQKYELPPDAEEKISAKGEKYEKLLSITGEAICHFRFKDELVWDDPGEVTHDAGNDAYSEFLSVNPTELAQSLACLPVHHILGISCNVFPDEQLTSMVDLAKNVRSQYVADTTEEVTGTTDHSEKKEPGELSTNSRLHLSPENDKDTPFVATLKHKEVSPTKLSLSSSVASVYIQSNLVDTCSGFNAGAVGQETINGKSDSRFKPPGNKLQLQDEDLDVLLNTDGPSEIDSTDGSSSIPSGKAVGDSKLASESEDLEAWLDSVLDD